MIVKDLSIRTGRGSLHRPVRPLALIEVCWLRKLLLETTPSHPTNKDAANETNARRKEKVAEGRHRKVVDLSYDEQHKERHRQRPE